MSPGTLLFDTGFTFHDGESGEKILVTLGSGQGITVVAKTTSRGSRFGLSFGCQSKNRFPCFHLPLNSCCLKQPTWICLDEFYEFNDALLMQHHFSGRIRRIGELPDDVTKLLLECAMDCDDISVAQARVVTEARKLMPN